MRALRWISISSLAVGAVVAALANDHLRGPFLVCTLISIFSFALLLSRLNRSVQTTLPYWVLFLYIWFAYYLKFYWFAMFPNTGLDVLPTTFSFESPTAWQQSYLTVTIGCTSTFVTAWLFIGNLTKRTTRQNSQTARAPAAESFQRLGFGALWTASIMAVLTTIITIRTGISVMGLESPELPYHLSGIVFLSRNVLIPALLLLAFWSGLEASNYRQAGVALLVTVIFGFTEMLLRSSRGALAPMVLSVAFLLILQRQLGRYRRSITATVLLVIVLHPVFSVYRNVRIDSGGTTNLARFILNASNSVVFGGEDVPKGGLKLAVTSVLLRPTGSELLLWYTGSGNRPLGLTAGREVLRSPRGLAGHITVETFGYSEQTITAIAPGLFGWFYFIGGNLLVLIGLAGLTAGIHVLWNGLQRLRLRTEQVAMAIFLTWLTTLVVDGVFDLLLDRTALIWPLSMLVCELMARTLGKMHHVRRKTFRISATTDPGM